MNSEYQTPHPNPQVLAYLYINMQSGKQNASKICWLSKNPAVLDLHFPSGGS